MIVDLTSNEKVVHGEFFNSEFLNCFTSNWIFTCDVLFFSDFTDLCDDDDLEWRIIFFFSCTQWLRSNTIVKYAVNTQNSWAMKWLTMQSQWCAKTFSHTGTLTQVKKKLWKEPRQVCTTKMLQRKQLSSFSS